MAEDRGGDGPNSALEPDPFRTPENRAVPRGGGLWTHRRPRSASGTSSELDKLLSLPYVTGSKPSDDRSGVTRYDPDRAYPGYNLYTSAHAPEARLIDMQGELLHRWSLDRDAVWPDLAGKDPETIARRYFRRVRLLEDGGLLAIFEYTGLVRLSARSRLLWAHRRDDHHDLDLDSEGNIYVLTRQARRLPYLPEPGLVWDDEITILSPGGEQRKVISISACLHRSSFAPLLDFARRFHGPQPVDPFHSNTIQVLDRTVGRFPFEAGNLLVSLRNLNTILVIDPEQQRVVWAQTGAWRMQHDPVLLPNGLMLLFDNRSSSDGSRVVEFDPWTQRVFWEYRGRPGEPFHSTLHGTNQRLANGNTLITESDYGRVFEVTPESEIVWEFVSPHRAGDKDEFVAVIPEMVRLPLELDLTPFAAR